MPEEITFIANLPAIQSAWKRHGGGEGARVQLDISEDQVIAALPLQMLTGQNLVITVRAAKEG